MDKGTARSLSGDQPNTCKRITLLKTSEIELRNRGWGDEFDPSQCQMTKEHF